MSVNPNADFTNWSHGSRSTYNAGCRCDACRDGAANYQYVRRRSDAARPLLLVRAEPWMDEAACASHDTHEFFPVLKEDSQAAYAAARLVCASCPVRARCLDYALDHSEKHGMWGGLAPKERRAAARRRRIGGGA